MNKTPVPRKKKLGIVTETKSAASPEPKASGRRAPAAKQEIKAIGIVSGAKSMPAKRTAKKKAVATPGPELTAEAVPEKT